MKISIWIDERQLENLNKLIRKGEDQPVMFERSDGYYPCDTNVIIPYDDFIYLRENELLVLEEEQY
jgi:hypothetical protein